MPLELHPATEPDTPTLATLYFTTFSDPFNTKLFPRTPDVYAWWTTALTKHIRDPRKRLLKVIDTDADPAKNEPRIVGFALWCLPAPISADDAEPVEDGFAPPWPVSCDAGFCERFFGENCEKQELVMAGRRHYHVNILGTHPGARRRGVATMLVQWGLERAGEEGVPVYLASTAQGRGVYERLGFEVRLEREVDGSVHDSMVWEVGNRE